MIRSRALVQYFNPYASVKMSLMAQAFSTTVEQLQKELAHVRFHVQISSLMMKSPDFMFSE
jgi:hypothetical protein